MKAETRWASEALQIRVDDARVGTQFGGRPVKEGTAIVECWDGDVAAAITQGAPGIRYILPIEGYRVWADAPCIPANALHTAAATSPSQHCTMAVPSRMVCAAACVSYLVTRGFCAVAMAVA